MKKITDIILSSALMLAAVSCSKESPFAAGAEGDGYGRVLTSSLSVLLKGDETRASAALPDVGDFMVEFVDVTSLDSFVVYASLYSDMPEVVSLPANLTYKVVAFYGDNPSAAWDSPYYHGESAEFDVEADKIVDSLDPVVCRLSNVRVTITFDDNLASVMGDDSKVSVKVGESGSLDFTKNSKDSGYFAYVEGSSTLAATFSGTVDGVAATETKVYKDVMPGTHYSITFRLHSPNAGGSGSIDPGQGAGGDSGIKVDAGVDISQEGGDVNIDPGDEIILDDESERPKEDPEEPGPGDDPNPPSPPDAGDGPGITADDPVDIDGDNTVTDGMACVLHVTSKTGLTTFYVDIDSTTLTPDELSGVGLSSHLDLVDPGELTEAIEGLGFPVNVGGLTDVDLDITGFLPMLSALGPGTHKFKLTVADSSGTTVKTLCLTTK